MGPNSLFELSVSLISQLSSVSIIVLADFSRGLISKNRSIKLLRSPVARPLAIPVTSASPAAPIIAPESRPVVKAVITRSSKAWDEEDLFIVIIMFNLIYQPGSGVELNVNSWLELIKKL